MSLLAFFFSFSAVTIRSSIVHLRMCFALANVEAVGEGGGGAGDGGDFGSNSHRITAAITTKISPLMWMVIAFHSEFACIFL